LSTSVAQGESILRFLYHVLEGFQSVFSRRRSWLLFAAVVLSFLAAPEMIGVTSVCRFWLGKERVYLNVKKLDYWKFIAYLNVKNHYLNLTGGARRNKITTQKEGG
jgi:hypothetical protein